MQPSQVQDYSGEGVVFFLHFLMVAAALLGLPAADKHRHCLEYLVEPPHFFADEVPVVQFQEPMISFILLAGPVATSARLVIQNVLVPSFSLFVVFVPLGPPFAPVQDRAGHGSKSRCLKLGKQVDLGYLRGFTVLSRLFKGKLRPKHNLVKSFYLHITIITRGHQCRFQSPCPICYLFKGQAYLLALMLVP